MSVEDYPKGKMLYYNAGGVSGVVGTYPSHKSGDFSFLPSHWNKPWIKTSDLHETYDAALNAPVAKFLGESY